MKMRIGILFVALTSLLIMTSASSVKVTTGIEFDQMTLAEAKALSAKTGKLIFIDCYTDWCGPCKRMAATSFKDPAVGKLYNDNFINLKIEMEKNPEGRDLAASYKVRAYPTLLIIDGKGNLIRQVVGMQTKDGLVMFANAAMK
jgi:thiol:disulfide interchange protein